MCPVTKFQLPTNFKAQIDIPTQILDIAIENRNQSSWPPSYYMQVLLIFIIIEAQSTGSYATDLNYFLSKHSINMTLSL